MAEEIKKADDTEAFDLGRAIGYGFAFAAGSAIFSGILWLGKSAIMRSRERKAEKAEQEAEDYY